MNYLFYQIITWTECFKATKIAWIFFGAAVLSYYLLGALPATASLPPVITAGGPLFAAFIGQIVTWLVNFDEEEDDTDPRVRRRQTSVSLIALGLFQLLGPGWDIVRLWEVHTFFHVIIVIIGVAGTTIVSMLIAIKMS